MTGKRRIGEYAPPARSEIFFPFIACFTRRRRRRMRRRRLRRRRRTGRRERERANRSAALDNRQSPAPMTHARRFVRTFLRLRTRGVIRRPSTRGIPKCGVNVGRGGGQGAVGKVRQWRARRFRAAGKPRALVCPSSETPGRVTRSRSCPRIPGR